MPKLTERQRRELRADIEANALSREQMIEKYGITERQLIRYLGEKDVKNVQGRPPKEKSEIEVEENIEDNTEPEERTDLSKIDLLRNEDQAPKMEVKQQTSTTDLELDPEKDYCATCYRQGRKTELLRGSTHCSICGSELEW